MYLDQTTNHQFEIKNTYIDAREKLQEAEESRRAQEEERLAVDQDLEARRRELEAQGMRLEQVVPLKASCLSSSILYWSHSFTSFLSADSSLYLLLKGKTISYLECLKKNSQNLFLSLSLCIYCVSV